MRALFVSDSLNEGFGQKDLVRMQDIQMKANGDHDKEISLATTQANIIKDAHKAKARAEAAEQVFGAGSEIAQIFHDRARELGGNYVQSKASHGALAPVVAPTAKGEKIQRKFRTIFPLPSERLKNPGEVKQSGFKRGIDPRAAMGTGMWEDKPEVGGESHWQALPILPLGKVNLGSGDCQYFNVKENWDNEGTVEVWKAEGGKHKLIFTSSSKPHDKLFDKRRFEHDQTRARLGMWELVDYVPLEKLDELIRVYGQSLSGYVYK